MKLTHQIALAAAVLLLGASLLAASVVVRQNLVPTITVAAR
ncbi:MAG: hypothetical protein R3F13_01895 [Prosthecobacter sp.]